MSMFSYKMQNPLFLAQLLSVYIIVDAICLLQMSFITYCVIKLCLTGTYKVSKDPHTEKWNYTTQGVPHRLRRIIVCVVLIPTVIIFDILYQVVFRDFFIDRNKARSAVQDEAQADEAETKEFDIGYWFLIYSIFLALHLINTVFIYQKMIGRRVKKMSGDEKVHDLPRLRWIAAIFITMITPICAVLLHRNEE